jgi:hypothetical protein
MRKAVSYLNRSAIGRFNFVRELPSLVECDRYRSRFCKQRVVFSVCPALGAPSDRIQSSLFESATPDKAATPDR